MSDANDALVGMLIGRIEVLERALLRAMILILSREPRRIEILKELEEDFRSFVLSLPMDPEEIQENARLYSDELFQKISSTVRKGHTHSEYPPTIDP